MPLIITPDIVIPDEELEWKFIRSSGPGGQNVNKVASAAQLRFLLPQNTSLPVNVRNRLRRLAGQKLIDDGSILFKSMSERSQDQNRRAALERLETMIRSALVEPRSARRRVRPRGRRSGASNQRNSAAPPSNNAAGRVTTGERVSDRLAGSERLAGNEGRSCLPASPTPPAEHSHRSTVATRPWARLSSGTAWRARGIGRPSRQLCPPLPARPSYPQATSNTAQHPPRLGAESDLQNAVPDLFGENQLGVRGNREQWFAE